MLRLVFMGKFGPLAPPSLENASPPASVATVSQLQAWVAEQVPALGSALATTPFKLIVNHAILHDLSTPLQPGDEVAFLPPMSGG